MIKDADDFAVAAFLIGFGVFGVGMVTQFGWSIGCISMGGLMALAGLAALKD